MKYMSKISITFIILLFFFNTYIYIFNTEPKIKYVEKEIIKEIKIKPKFEIFEITFYTEGYESTGKSLGDKGYGITASGEPVIEGRTMACPASIPFNTAIYVKELENIFYCTDRGSAITEGKLDIYTSDLNKALEMGRNKMEVFIFYE